SLRLASSTLSGRAPNGLAPLDERLRPRPDPPALAPPRAPVAGRTSRPKPTSRGNWLCSRSNAHWPPMSGDGLSVCALLIGVRHHRPASTDPTHHRRPCLCISNAV